MVVISLTSIPPRFEQLPSVLASLRQQGADRIILTIPERYRRFPGPVRLPALPPEVEVLRIPDDMGPATKVLPAARLLRDRQTRLVYCDDDCIYGAGWLSALTSQPAQVVAGSAFDVARLGRKGPGTIVQGFAGVCITPNLLQDAAHDIPEAAWPVDDIWLSGHFALSGATVRIVPLVRSLVTPQPGPGLQDALFAGLSRDASNRACCDALTDRFGIWPKA